MILLITGEIVSIGKTTPETNKSRLPVEMEAKVPVSSDLNEYPIPIPMNENTEEESSNIPATGNSCKILPLEGRDCQNNNYPH